MSVAMKHKVSVNVLSPSIALAVLILFSMTVCASASVKKTNTAENLMSGSNPGFEQPIKDGKITGWTVAYGNAKVVTDTKYSGKQSLWCSTDVKVYNDQLIKVEPGYSYHIAAWGKYKNLKFIPDKYGVGCGLEQVDANKVCNGNWYDMQTYLKYGEGNTDWSVATRTWIIKDTTVYLRPFILVQAYDGSQIWFDEFRVWKEKLPEKTVDTKLNVIENGSFEVRYAVGGAKPNRFDIKAPKSLFDTYNNRMTCVEDTKYNGVASMKIAGECTVISYAGYLASNNATAQIAVKTVGVKSKGSGAFAKLVLYDNARRVVKTRSVLSQKGTLDWKVYRVDLKDINKKKIRYAQWEFGMDKGSTGVAYFDDLQVNVLSTLRPLPRRDKDTAHATVNVNCAVQRSTFDNPLCAFDSAGEHLAYSPMIGTAGKYIEGPGKWFSERRRLGFKYVRMHDVYSPQYMCAVAPTEEELHAPEGYVYPFNKALKLSYHAARTYYPESNELVKPAYIEDKDGNPHYDFSGIKYLLDKSILASGCKPIIGLYGIPYDLGLHGNPASLWDYRHYAPKDYKKWEELNYQFIKFLVDTYGKDEIRTWVFETGNEPGTEPEWIGVPGKREDAMNEFFKFQDYTIEGARRALPDIYISGPSGGSWTPEMIDHCSSGINYANGKRGTKLEALTIHNYWGGGASDLSWRPAEQYILTYLSYVKRYEQVTGYKMDMLDTEFSPICMDGVPPIAAITPARENHVTAIAAMHYGYLAWKFGLKTVTFFFENPSYGDLKYDEPRNQVPEFAGMNTCISYHGIFKPICRSAQLMSMLNGGQEVQADADKEPIWVLASMKGNQIKVLCYSFDVDPRAKYTTSVDVLVKVGELGRKFKVTKYELSETKANSWYLAQQMNLTQADCDKDISIVERINAETEPKAEDAGIHEATDGVVHVNLSMPSFSVTVLVMEKVD
ncbi:MAG: hypothetical protein ABFD54_14680 [Armatimonadota bacterium]